MLEDYDYMTQVLRYVFPAVTVNKKVYGFDVFDKLKFYRTKITEDMTSQRFMELLYYSLLACKGDHLWLFDLYPYKDHQYIKEITSIEEKTIEINHVYWKNFKPKLGHSNYISVHLLYHNGDYYNRYDFTCGGTKYKYGMKLLSVDDKTPAEILPSLQDYFTLFDFDKDIFYGGVPVNNNFYALMSRDRKKSQEFKFEDKNEQVIKLSIADESNIFIHKPDKAIFTLKKTVEYFKEKQILYIRIPEMDEKDIPFYIAEIKKNGTNRKISAVILDIRNNGGGGDLVWRRILESIIRKEYRLQATIAIRNTILAKEHEAKQSAFYKKMNDDIYFDDKNKYIDKKIHFLNNEEFLVKETEDHIKPAADSLNTQAPIYVIAHNIYSSSGNLVAFAKDVDDIISVGTRNPKVIGQGSDIFLKNLPNSKIIFTLQAHLDLTRCKSAEDTLHTKMEVEVEMTAKERLDYINRDISNIPLEEALTKYDPYFKKVLELQKIK